MEPLAFFKKFSLLPQGLRYKLLISFCLMSIIPLLVMLYLINNLILLKEGVSLIQGSIMLLFCVIIAWLGLFLAKDIIERVINIALDTRAIINGDYGRRITVDTTDEIGQIGKGINLLTKKIKDNIGDLKDYQMKMKEVNADIEKKMSILANVLQIAELISSSVKLDSILQLILSKLSQLYDEGFAALYLSKDKPDKFAMYLSHNLENEELSKATIEKGKDVLGRVLTKKKHLVMDASSKFSREDQEFKTRYKCENIVAFPVLTMSGVTALLLAGNNLKNFTYTSDDIEMIKLFAEQMAISIENDSLMKKAKNLEIKDKLTGLFNKPYITNRLNEEIKRSVVSQKPCSYIMLDLDDFKIYESKKGQRQAEEALKKVAHLIVELSGPIGKAGRLDKNSFGLIMPEANKKEALEVAEKIRKKVEDLSLSADEKDRITVSCGVAENPLDGSRAEEILEKAENALAEAKAKGKNKVLGSGG